MKFEKGDGVEINFDEVPSYIAEDLRKANATEGTVSYFEKDCVTHETKVAVSLNNAVDLYDGKRRLWLFSENELEKIGA